MRRKVAAGNWKMNGLSASISELETLKTVKADCDVIICPPATLIATMVKTAGDSGIVIGGQNCHSKLGGAHTGDISAEMLADIGARAVILGHSERRADHNETSSDVHAKVSPAWAAGLQAIICIGETEAERDAGTTLSVIGEQLAASTPNDANAKNTIIAYEPIWAIGTGRTPTLAEIVKVHDYLRAHLVDRFEDGDHFRILYGGSVKPSNAAEIFALSNVDGGLVGGASLKAADFGEIIKAAS